MAEAPAPEFVGFAEMMRPARDAVRHHWAPLLFIQLAALALVVVYFNSPGLQAALTSVEQFKSRGGILFSFGAGATAGGIIPQIARFCTGKMGPIDREWVSRAAYNALVYGLVGIEVDLFYTGQTNWFGSGRDWGTLCLKTANDMFLFSPIIAIPTAVMFYAWRSNGFERPRLGLMSSIRFYRDRILPSMILAWIFWVPVLFGVYSLPANLQFPFSSLAEAAWSMVFVFFNTDGGS